MSSASLATGGRAPAQPPDWSIVIPLKDLDDSKSRMTLAPQVRRRLAAGFAADVIESCLRTPTVGRVVVVSPRAPDLPVLNGRVEVISDAGRGVNEAIVLAAEAIPDGPTAVIMADLPSLRAPDVGRFLEQSRAHRRSFVCDAAGIGTTALAAQQASWLRPGFGPGSRARHRSEDAHELPDPALFRLRRDVDTLVDLFDARRIGVGAHTADALLNDGG
ncbi:MAG: 2-phospho-L-lactate guanylyltransferase [Actinobacteria bacterium]|nr:2-phospho-L-lactate guanylyltransferase [Actinomycetota bacterium]